MSYTYVNPGAMDQIGERIVGLYSQVTTTLDDLRADLDGTLAEWNSDARTAYDAAKRNWDQDAQHKAETLQAFGRYLPAVGQGAQRTDWQAAQLYT